MVERPIAPPSIAPSGNAALDVAMLYRAHARQVARWAARLAGPWLEVEDVVQEVFLIAQRRLPTFRGESEITTWLYSITHNVVRHRRRGERWRLRLSGNDGEIEERASTQPGPAEELERRRAAIDLYRILDCMRERYRTVLILFELEGLPGEDIARLTGTRLSTVWVHLHRARAQFLARMQELYPDEAARPRVAVAARPREEPGL
jgi:RNA polymerase sigma-70 factor (ECF subfamily)